MLTLRALLHEIHLNKHIKKINFREKKISVSFLGYLSFDILVIFHRKQLKFLPRIDDLSNFAFKFGKSFWPPLPLATSKNAQKPGFLQTNDKKSKNKKIVTYFLGISKVERFMYRQYIKISELYLYSKCAFFRGETNTMYTFYVLYTFFAGRPYVRAK